LTLLRSVGKLSRNDFITRSHHAGPQIETPEAQCLGLHTFEYSIIPHAGTWETAASFWDAFDYCTPVDYHSVDRSTGPMPDELSFLTLEPAQLVLSSLKRSEDKSGIVVRLYNITDRVVSGSLEVHRPILKADLVSLNEEFLQPIALDSELSFHLEVGPRKIVTIKLTYNNDNQKP
jgi:mannosylglycerate hydrolase